MTLNSTIQRIVTFHLRQIGDLLFSLPALQALRQGFPQAEIVSVVPANLADLLQASPLIDDFLIRPLRGMKTRFHLVRALRRRKFDLAIAFSQSRTATLYSYLSGAKQRVGFTDSAYPWLLTHRVDWPGLPTTEKFLGLVADLGLEADQEDYVGLLRIAPEDEGKATEILSEAGVSDSDRLIALAPGASGKRLYKSWGPDKFALVAQKLVERYRSKIIIVGAPQERALGDQILASVVSAGTNLAGETSTGQLAAMLARSDLLIGIDAGPMHVAAAMGTPVVALFGPTDPEKTGPQGKGHVIVRRDLDCSPCRNPDCPDRKCMDAISVEDVLAAVERIIPRA